MRSGQKFPVVLGLLPSGFPVHFLLVQSFAALGSRCTWGSSAALLRSRYLNPGILTMIDSKNSDLSTSTTACQLCGRDEKRVQLPSMAFNQEYTSDLLHLSS